MIQTDGLTVSLLFERKGFKIQNSNIIKNQEYVYIDEFSEEQLSLLGKIITVGEDAGKFIWFTWWVRQVRNYVTRHTKQDMIANLLKTTKYSCARKKKYNASGIYIATDLQSAVSFGLRL